MSTEEIVKLNIDLDADLLGFNTDCFDDAFILEHAIAVLESAKDWGIV